jgi:hypothetical protein
VFQEEPGEEQV